MDQRSAILEKVHSLGYWYHPIDLDEQICTVDHPDRNTGARREALQEVWEVLRSHFPADCTKSTILDVGCSSGFFTLQCAQYGFRRVYAIDPRETAVKQVCFLKKHLRLRTVKVKHMSVYHLRKLRKHFTCALMLNVLYHLDHPLLGLKRAADVTDMLFLQSCFQPGEEPKMHWRRSDGYEDGWVPTQSCLEAMVRHVGFTDIVCLGQPKHRPIYLCRK